MVNFPHDAPSDPPAERPLTECAECNGSGTVPCKPCNGRGFLEVPLYQVIVAGELWNKTTKDCDHCIFGSARCEFCDGSGQIVADEAGHSCSDNCKC